MTEIVVLSLTSDFAIRDSSEAQDLEYKGTVGIAAQTIIGNGAYDTSFDDSFDIGFDDPLEGRLPTWFRDTPCEARPPNVGCWTRAPNVGGALRPANMQARGWQWWQ
jgi:hypothetical protein